MSLDEYTQNKIFLLKKVKPESDQASIARKHSQNSKGLWIAKCTNKKLQTLKRKKYEYE